MNRARGATPLARPPLTQRLSPIRRARLSPIWRQPPRLRLDRWCPVVIKATVECGQQPDGWFHCLKLGGWWWSYRAPPDFCSSAVFCVQLVISRLVISQPVFLQSVFSQLGLPFTETFNQQCSQSLILHNQALFFIMTLWCTFNHYYQHHESCWFSLQCRTADNHLHHSSICSDSS